MAIILSIETSTSVCSAALHENGNLVATKELHTPQSAASQLGVQIEALFNTTKITRRSLEAVAVSSGPGSYTALRIGVAMAKGICYGLDIPLIALDSLLVLAAGVSKTEKADLLCPMIDARRMEVYCCLFDRTLERIDETRAKIIDVSSFSDQLLKSSVLFFGDGAAKCQGIITHPNAFFLQNSFPLASNMGNLAFKRFKTGQHEDLMLFEPTYLKEFIAKTKLT
jgi:tRNA threonylcarbamoyladenosine biosynthesis protein TsaB